MSRFTPQTPWPSLGRWILLWMVRVVTVISLCWSGMVGVLPIPSIQIAPVWAAEIPANSDSDQTQLEEIHDLDDLIAEVLEDAKGGLEHLVQEAQRSAEDAYLNAQIELAEKEERIESELQTAKQALTQLATTAQKLAELAITSVQPEATQDPESTEELTPPSDTGKAAEADPSGDRIPSVDPAPDTVTGDDPEQQLSDPKAGACRFPAPESWDPQAC